MFKTKVFLVESSTRAHLLSNTGTFVPSQDVGNRAPKICRAPNAQRRGSRALASGSRLPGWSAATAGAEAEDRGEVLREGSRRAISVDRERKREAVLVLLREGTLN